MAAELETVQVALLTAPGCIQLTTFPRPATGPSEGLLLVEANGICGTDVHFRSSDLNVPRILGHEVVGRLVELGDLAAERWGVTIGDRVAVEAGIVCGACRECIAGYGQSCVARLNYGSSITTRVPPALWGGLAQLMHLAPGTILTKIDDYVPADVAAGWFSPLANAVDWTGPLGGGVEPGQVVLILGPGPQGLAACIAAKARGAGTVVLAGLAADRHRLEAGRMLGADHVVASDKESVIDLVRGLTEGELADVVLDVSGAVSSAGTAARVVRRRGTIVAASPINATQDVALPLRDMIWNQIRWQGVLSNRAAATPAAADLLGRFADRLRPLITHHFDLTEADRAIDVVAGRYPGEDPIKVVVCPNGIEA